MRSSHRSLLFFLLYPTSGWPSFCSTCLVSCSTGFQSMAVTIPLKPFQVLIRASFLMLNYTGAFQHFRFFSIPFSAGWLVCVILVFPLFLQIMYVRPDQE